MTFTDFKSIVEKKEAQSLWLAELNSDKLKSSLRFKYSFRISDLVTIR